jgi:cytochrome c556
MVLLAFAAVLIALGGCGKGNNDGQPVIPVGPGDGGGTPSKIKQIMMKVGKGPQALNQAIGKGLDAEEPAWDTVQPQAKEYAQLAADLGQNDPPKGSTESWKKLTGAYAASAAALDRAAQAKDQTAAKAAHKQLTDSCMSCHREHRQMGPRGGG